MKSMLDLYSGLGGASEAFVRAGWDVTRVENNPLLADPRSNSFVPGTTNFDVLKLERPYHFGEPYDFIWASPPCREFSSAYNAPGPTATRAGLDFEPDLTLLLKAKEIIDYLDPKYWVIENVQGGRKVISEALNMPPRQIVGPFFLWGKFPYVDVPREWVPHHKGRASRHGDPLRANKRAKIPLALSEAFLRVCETQPSLSEWIQ
jgi:hypothetical protein